ncbi:MAG: pentapeptide repeat-containing protein [Candidatus Caenarcaniphilales bacterium]|nr:pentapeptide repeat-containing protein [Candidatus Caenarcaniphilales bacterium]
MPDEELEAVPDLDEEQTEDNQEAAPETEEVNAEDTPEQDTDVGEDETGEVEDSEEEASEGPTYDSEEEEADSGEVESDSEDKAEESETEDSSEESDSNPKEEASAAEEGQAPKSEADKPSKDSKDAEETQASIKQIKESLSKDLTIVDEALTDEEFLERINSRNVFERFDKYIKYQVNTVSDFEAIAKSKLLQLLIVIGLIGGIVFFVWSLKFDDQEDYKHLIGYIKINRKLPEGVKGPFNEEVKDIIRNYVKHPEKYLDHTDLPLHHHHEKKKEIIMSDKYPGLITNDQLLLILEEQDLGKVSARGTEYTEKINLSGLDLRSVDFKYLNKFIQSNMKGVNLMGVYIEDAQFRGAQLEGSDLSLADLRDSSFIRSKVCHVKFIETDLTNANFYGAKGELANFTKSFLAGVNFKEIEMKEAQFNGALAFSTNFRDAFLLGANFSQAKLKNANFKGANLTAVDFRGADLTGVNFEEAILHGANFRGANVQNANFSHAQVQKALLKDAEELTIEQLEAADKSHRAASLPEWVNKSKLSWKKRF